MFPLNRPEAMVPIAQGKVDEQGRLTDEKIREFISNLIEVLVV